MDEISNGQAEEHTNWRRPDYALLYQQQMVRCTPPQFCATVKPFFSLLSIKLSRPIKRKLTSLN
jgi:hypothetical protein